MCSSEVQPACLQSKSLDSWRYISLLGYLMLFPAQKVQEVFTLPLSNATVTEILLLRQPVLPAWEEQNLNSRWILASYATTFL